jgi:hypothetical protein
MEPESRDPARDGRALREMAKLANGTAPGAASPSKGPPRKPNADHSGLVDLAALMAQEPNWLEGALARAKVSAGGSLAPPSVFAAGSIAPTISEVGVGNGTGDTERAHGVPRSRSLPLVLACAGAGLLVAAACIFAVRMGHHGAPAQAAVQAVAVATVDAPVIPPVPAAVPAPATPDPVAPAAAAAAQVAAATPDESTAPEPTAPTGHHGRHGRHGAEARIAAATAPVAAPVANTPAPTPHGTPSAPHAGSALDAALRAAAGPAAALPAADPAPAPAAAKAPPPAAEGRPERPSGSAVTSALTEVLPAAKKCVAAMTDPSRALVTFGSEGKVQKVDVTGPAGSDPKATQCLRSAFGRAHVPAFSQASYAAGVTVRP